MSAMEKITCIGELIITLRSKDEWRRKIPRRLPEKRKAEQRLWLDANGNCLAIGEDFTAAEQIASYPVRVYSLQRVVETFTKSPFNSPFAKGDEERTEPVTNTLNVEL